MWKAIGKWLLSAIIEDVVEEIAKKTKVEDKSNG